MPSERPGHESHISFRGANSRGDESRHISARRSRSFFTPKPYAFAKCLSVSQPLDEAGARHRFLPPVVDHANVCFVQGTFWPALTPADGDADIAGHAAGIIDDFVA